MVDLTPLERWTLTRLFGAAWYAATYPDADSDGLAHFQARGAAAGHDPNPLFSTSWYRARYPESQDGGLNPLEDYVARGAALRRDPGPLFSTAWYLASNPDVAAAGLNPLEHYLEWGPAQLRDPSPVFDSGWYFASYPPRLPGMDARLHYLSVGAAKGYSPCALFDARWYRRRYPDVAAAGDEPLLHYLLTGAAEGRDPGPQFSTRAYLARHPELAGSGTNPLVHRLARERAPAGPPPDALVNRLSAEAIAQARSLLAELAVLDADLAALPAVPDRVAPAAPPRPLAAWRALYLSLVDRPRHVVLVGHIDAAQPLAGMDPTLPGLLVIETDGAAVSTAEGLPDGVAWRALSEFEPALNPAERVAVLATFMAVLRPDSVAARASVAGAALLAGDGGALPARIAMRAG